MATKVRVRRDIPAKHKWKTTDLFDDDAAWHARRDAFLQSLTGLSAFAGTLCNGDDVVLACLTKRFELHQELALLGCYAARMHDQDTTVPDYQAMRELAEKTSIAFSQHSAFIEPELLSLPDERLQGMIESTIFADYARFLEHVLRSKPHVLSADQESLLASHAAARDSGHTIFSTFCAADLTFPEVRDERGRKARLTQALFAKYRGARKRSVRRSAFKAFFGTYKRHQNTFAAMLSAQVNANITVSRARSYESALEAALSPDELTPDVYDAMLRAVRKNLPLLFRYLKLRRKLLGLKKLRYDDLYVPLVDRARFKIPYEEGCKLLLSAVSPLGEAYVNDLKRGLSRRAGWVDVYPNRGKRSGAYMDGSAYDVHPYVLGNYLDDYNSLSMVAHEMGHAMHSYYSNATQPYAKSDYTIFVAEVASTLNEALLAKAMLDRETDKRRRLFLLGEQLEGFRQTMFRQAMFADFELSLYRHAEGEGAVTAEALSAMYLKLARLYYGHKDGVCQVHQRYAVEWAYIPHFYYHFYVFQYVTGMTAATALSELVLNAPKGDHGPRDRYLQGVLHAGCKHAPLDLLRAAGVDLAREEPYDIAFAVMERTLAEAEELARKL